MKDLLVPNNIEDMNISHISVDMGNIIILDNFWKNPNSIIDFSNSAHFVNKPSELLGNYPGYRTYIPSDFTSTEKVLSIAWKKELELQEPFAKLSKISKGSIVENINVPHQDPGVSYLCYLNKEDAGTSGTAIYHPDSYEIIKYIDSKFNRGVLFTGSIIHSALLKQEVMDTEYRLTLNAFLMEK